MTETNRGTASIRRALVLVLLLLAACPRARAQQKTEGSGALSELAAAQDRGIAEAVEAGFASDDVRERAWAAYLAGARGLTTLIPRLVATLRNVDEADYVVAAAFDSLVVLRADVPADALEAHYDTFPGATIALLGSARDPDVATLSRLAATARSDAEWLATNNLLAATRAPGVAARLLVDLSIAVRVTVRDRTGLGMGMGGGVGTSCGGGQSPSPDGFPPIATYGLEMVPSPGATVVADGPRPVYLVRHLLPDAVGCPGRSAAASTANRDRARAEYLAWLLGASPADAVARPALDVAPGVIIEWRGARSFSESLAQERARLVGEFAALVERLAAAGALTREEADAARPHYVVTVFDGRGDGGAPLPRVVW